jgi:hypothetical protein
MSANLAQLGIAEMDDDHARIDALFDSAVGKSSAELPAQLRAVQTELAS